MKSIIKFVSDSDAVKERQLKAFAASISATGQKLSYDPEQLKSQEDGSSVTVIDPTVPLTIGFPLPPNSFVFRYVDSLANSNGELELSTLLASGIDVGLLKRNEYFEMPLVRLILLNALGVKDLDLAAVLLWGGIKKSIEVGESLNSRLQQLSDYYQIDTKLMEELGFFNKLVIMAIQDKIASSEMVFVADGICLGLVHRVELCKELLPEDLTEILKNVLARDVGQIVVKVLEKKQLQIAYFVRNLDNLCQNKVKRIGWFTVGANKLVDKASK